jgi:signal transduction histidine kinase
LLYPENGSLVAVQADPAQVRLALLSLLRNAIEAAPADGWVTIQVEAPAHEPVRVIVEDNGPGLSPGQREHLFDPVYSGRQAGRGRGLGLPTAWRLARAHGGDVQYVASADGPTRFVLSLPSTSSLNGSNPQNGCNGLNGSQGAAAASN